MYYFISNETFFGIHLLYRGDKINKICRVLGVEWPQDPDETYELTEDNAKKMLAIHMRFRWESSQ
jgi:hypothetical protein